MQKLIKLFVILITFLTGCQQSSPTKEDQKISLRLSVNRDPATLDPRKGADIVSSFMHFLLFEGLTKLEDDGQVSLGIADKIDLSEDKLTYTFHLKECKWSDGSLVTAKDFETAWKNQLDPQFPCSNTHLLYAIKNAEEAKKGLVSLDQVGIRTLDDKTLEVSLHIPTPQFLGIIAFCTFSPVKTDIVQKYPEWCYGPGEHYICNGPYILKSWKHNHELVISKNPNYWNRDAFCIDTIYINVIDNEMTALHMYENGELDLIASSLSPIPLDAIREYASKGLLKTVEEPGSTVCFFNTEQYPFNNKNIRKAFALALNREEIVSNITQLNETSANATIAPALNQNYKALFKDNDAASAKAFLQKGLEELGLIDASELGEIKYNYFSSETYRKVAQAIQQQWFKALGIRVTLEQVEYKILLDMMAKRSYQVAQGIWVAQYLDRMNILERFKSKQNVKNYSGWENPTFARLLDESNYASTIDERIAILEKAEALLIEDMPVTPIFHLKSALLAQQDLELGGSNPSSSIFFEKLSIKARK